MRLNEDPPEEIGTPEAGWDGKARRTQRPQGERAERFELPEPVPGTFSAAAGDREDMPEGQRDAGTAPVEQLYPTAKVKPEPFTVPQVNSGEEHVLFVQVLLCALLVAFVFFARSAGAPFLEDMRAEYHEMMTAGVEFSTDNAFARFANGVVEDLRMGAERLVRQLEDPEALDGQGGFWPGIEKREVPDGASMDDYTLPQELLLPVAGPVTSGYGFRDNPVNGADDFHAGVDIAAAEGTPVAAAQSGQVVRTGYNRLRGYYIIIRHEGSVQTLYQHLSYIFVRGGETVTQGQTVAAVGSTGLVTGPHLHLEIILDGVRVDPMPSFLLCACLAAGLLFDPMGFLRMTLVCAFVHESGHVLAYMLCAHKLPGLHFSAGGIGLSGAEQLPRTQELWVLAAGPLANFIRAALLFLQLHRQASYALYFLAAVSLCTGVYNLMPFGVLDGARLLQNLLPAEKQDALRRAQRLLLCLFCAAALGFALLGGMPRGARAAAFLGPGYLLAKEFRQK